MSRKLIKKKFNMATLFLIIIIGLGIYSIYKFMFRKENFSNEEGKMEREEREEPYIESEMVKDKNGNEERIVWSSNKPKRRYVEFKYKTPFKGFIEGSKRDLQGIYAAGDPIEGAVSKVLDGGYPVFQKNDADCINWCSNYSDEQCNCAVCGGSGGGDGKEFAFRLEGCNKNKLIDAYRNRGSPEVGATGTHYSYNTYILESELKKDDPDVQFHGEREDRERDQNFRSRMDARGDEQFYHYEEENEKDESIDHWRPFNKNAGKRVKRGKKGVPAYNSIWNLF